MTDAMGDPFDDDPAAANQTVTNDAVAGETVLDGAGDGNDGPTGGSPKEQTPIYDEHGTSPEKTDLGAEYPDRGDEAPELDGQP